MIRPPLTRRQKQVLDFCEYYIIRHGISPTLDEIRTHLKLKAISTVFEHLDNLKWKGYITRDMNVRRGVMVVDFQIKDNFKEFIEGLDIPDTELEKVKEFFTTYLPI